MINSRPLLEMKELSITYNTENQLVRAVEGFNLQIGKGETVGIIGESGCGKTTLALGIMGLLKNCHIEGEIIYKGQKLNDLPERKLRQYRWKEIALVFQNSIGVFNPVLNIGEQLGEPLRIHYGLSSNELEQKVIKLMEMVGLEPEWRKYYPHQLSGGMRQRVLLAMALACEPELIVVDEPTTALDPISKTEILSLLYKLQKKNGFAMILISHDLNVIKSLTSRVATMYYGRIVEMGLTSEVFKTPMHPYTRGLLNSSPELFKYKDLWGIEGEVSSKADEGCVFYNRCCQRSEACSKAFPSLKYIGVERMVACHKGGIELKLKAKDIRKKYTVKDKSIEALKGVSLEIRSGEVVALIGESGSGKSTLAHILAGVLSPESGQVFYRNKLVDGKWATKMIGGMQIVFQDPFSATSHRMKVMEVVREPLDIIGFGSDKDREQLCVQALQMVKLPTSADFLTRYCCGLSGGQRQRLAIARALVTKPGLVIADEVTSMLDPSTQANLLRELKGIQNKYGFSMLYITHDLSLARKIADKVYVMFNGEIVERGSALTIFENPEHIYTKRFFKRAFGNFDFKGVIEDEYRRFDEPAQG